MAELLGYTCKHIQSHHSTVIGERDNWASCLESMGFTPTFPNRLSNPAFMSVRYSHSAKEWATMIIQLRYQFLTTLDNVVKGLPEEPDCNQRRKAKGKGVVGRVEAGQSTKIENSYLVPQLNSAFYQNGLDLGAAPLTDFHQSRILRDFCFIKFRDSSGMRRGMLWSF